MWCVGKRAGGERHAGKMGCTGKAGAGRKDGNMGGWGKVVVRQ